MRTASGSRRAFRDARGEGAIVFDPARLQQAGPELFQPEQHRPEAELILGGGGRGAAWYVSGEFGQGVLRHYRRGGWMARLGRQTYLWQGEAAVRSFREFRLLEELRGDGLPVPAPIAAMYRRDGLGYGAAIIVERLRGAIPFLASVAGRGPDAPWEEVGSVIAAFHRHGAHHADLNANNILLAEPGQVMLIDWDKGRTEPGPGPWCRRVLNRLERSIRKDCADVPALDIAGGMQRLCAAHDQALRR